MTSVTLNCLVVGEDPYEKTLPVDIDINKNIGALKKAIKNDIGGSVSARDLKLFKVDIHLGITRDENAVTMLKTVDLSVSLEMDNNLQKISVHFSTQPADTNLHILVQLPTVAIEQPVAGSKRSFDEMQVDRTALICDTLIQSFNTIPNHANDLRPLVSAQLVRKLPVSFYEEKKFPQFAEYIQTSDDECGSNLAKHISCLLTDIFEKQDFDDTSEDMVHWGIDSLIRIPLQIFRESLGGGVLPIEMDRNSKDQGTTTVGNKRPDFLCWINDVLLFKGEEKADAKDFSIAERELEDKFNTFDPLNFGNIQFMLCYAVAGPNLRFYAIDGSQNANPLNRLVPLSNRLDIKNSRDRVSILCIVVNIARIIRTVSGSIHGSIVPIGKRMKLEKSTITFFDDSVEKMVPLKDLPYGNDDGRVAFLLTVYNCAKGHPGLIQIKKGGGPKIRNRGTYRVVFETRGRNFQLNSENEAREMARSVLTGLTWLHENDYVHCDIRLPNIVFVPGIEDYKYVLIDFEHSNISGFSPSENLRDWDRRTLNKKNKYTIQSDLYQFAKMLRNLNIVNSGVGNDFLEEISGKLLEGCKILLT
ncbi:hypothetical protein RCL_jg19337.t1 [Rhizophagus clarus]|uniref:Crinkler effector protein N-terminal domain-containing protein n=1 Tax=Rhizophagus clarus TaxID=94130 RepID=A0A8H3LZZ6_9GLOM|nr:hypothetical protein RCL_jg19337.t1 [Rhizophagus clarus]